MTGPEAAGGPDPADPVARLGAADAAGGWRPVLGAGAVLRRCDVRQAELLIVPERIVVLNDEAAAIIRLCDGGRTVAEIVAEFPPEGAADVRGFLDDVRARGWLR
ncbi:pyrroloquinoline quinone biosynthesis peptide chaperone PqqD [Nonomuraea jiangxiensis]|uniref:Pyrroloquinoline quinone biosynthesis protein D n=1 Tax=Nonomuraea jiangxiensis TaxID=633440 RepID=A0A1G9G2R3_9ACTN|nr:pyrroloquinoline quinone biosynthesis peptide chaperone PqqD [Nonomuraea jiangxiensis]SDK94946.1 pyrroloquinoline quinone biosynthesis protein D [Nonomuraea jiangxiensis]